MLESQCETGCCVIPIVYQDTGDQCSQLDVARAYIGPQFVYISYVKGIFIDSNNNFLWHELEA